MICSSTLKNVVVRLLYLVKKHHRVRLAPEGLGKLTALLLAGVSRRRSDEAGDGVLLHVLAHIQPHHGALVVEEGLRESPVVPTPVEPRKITRSCFR
jgi:hypothetical protein